MKLLTISFTLIFSILSTSIWAETQYVTDEFKVTLRTGSSTSNSILTMLKSGETVKVIQQDEDTKYTLVETSKGVQGYMLTRFLDTQPSGRQLHAQLQTKSKKQKESIKSLKSKLNTLKTSKNDADTNLNSTNKLLTETTDELDKLKNATRNTVAVIEKNKTQQTLIQQLELEKSQLLIENNDLKDSTAMDWFIRGSGVTLLAFFFGILVTKIRWKKSDSWGDF